MTLNQQENLQQIFLKAQKSQQYVYKILQIGRAQGFSNFLNRRQIWPFLIGLDQGLDKLPVYSWKININRRCSQYEQIVKDSERSLYRFKSYECISKFHLMKKQQSILEVINCILLRNPELRYLQGFHQVVSIVLTIFDNNKGFYVAQKLAKTYFYDILTAETDKIGFVASQIIFDIVTLDDPQFKKIFMYYHDRNILIFILPWMITWFCHIFSSIKTIARIWDYLLCTGPHGVFYLCSAFILETRIQLITNCEQFNQASIQTFYQQRFKIQGLDVEKIISKAIQLEQKMCVTELPSYEMLNNNSMYKQQNFYIILPIHQKFQQFRKNSRKKQKRLKTAVVIGGAAFAIAMFGAAFLFKKNIKFGQIKQL